MKKDFETVLSREIEKVIVILRIEPYFRSFDDANGMEKVYLIKKKDFDVSRRLMMKLPLHLNYDGYMYDNKNSINALIVREMDAILGKMKQDAEDQNVRFFDGVQFVIEYIGSQPYKKEEGIDEWIPTSI
jgi:hypothetical protein